MRAQALVISIAVSVLALGTMSCSSDVSGPNRPPVAVAGSDLYLQNGQTAILDGSASYDPEGDSLSYQWELLASPGGSATIVNGNSAQANLSPDMVGMWVVGLTVSDGELDSLQDVVLVYVEGCETDADCADDLWCTVNETCDRAQGRCVHDDRDCSGVADDCNAGVCDEGADACAAQPVADGTACTDDGFFCNGAETCQSGVCTAAGNPCDPPESCDEILDVCGGCGDGEVTGLEDCDPAAPQSDNCCNAATCRWVESGLADPQAQCSGAPECQLDVCDGAGGCMFANATNGTPCGDDTDTLCDNPDSCLDGQCEANLEPNGTQCRGAVESCDAPEYCDGLSPDCPQDEMMADGTECRAAAGDCDAPEYCDGSNPECPPDVKRQSAFVCRESTDADCDPEEYCDGANDDCPTDYRRPNNTPCTTDGLFCTGPEQCQGGVCTSMGNPCTPPEDCDEDLGRCGECGNGTVEANEECDYGSPQNDNCCSVSNCHWAGVGQPDPQGVCDVGVPECYEGVCDAVGSCTTQMVGNGTECGGTPSGTCDAQDTCLDGSCQPNYAPPTRICRNDSGQGCDVAEYCTGSSPDCPGDGFRDAGYECRAEAGDCNPADFCSGDSPQCPLDSRYDSSHRCRDANGACDVAEYCTGGSDDCPNDAFATSGVCRAANGACDVAESCDGTSRDCPGDVFATSGVCRGINGACDVAESCDGSSRDCPDDVFATSGVCRGINGACDVAESCDGSGPDCPDDGYASSGECRGINGACDVAEQCDGIGPDCPLDGFVSEGVECRMSTDPVCDPAEFCTGSSADCPLDVIASEHTPCTDSTPDDCVLAQCDTTGNCVQDYAIASEHTPCDTGLDPCLSGDECDTSGVCQEGSITKDDDNDGDIDEDCGGSDCDDDDPDVAGTFTEGPTVCDASCHDGKDNDCDDDTDTVDSACQGTNYICVEGPDNPVNIGNTGTITVRMDGSGKDESAIVCYTQDARLLTSQSLFSQDFESGSSGINASGGWTGRGDWGQNPLSGGDTGFGICLDAVVTTDAINTTGRTRIQLRYAAVSAGLDDNEYYITEYSVDGTNWYVLDVQGDNYREDWQWYTHILPPACEDQASLQIRWRVTSNGGTGDCGMLDDISIVDLPEPTVSWTLLENHFEASEGNSTNICADNGSWILLHFDEVGSAGHENKTCLVGEAQNPNGPGGSQGLRVNDNHPTWVRDPDIDTQYVPSGSDLVVDFWMREDNLGANGYANGWYSYDSGSTWYRLNGMGLNCAELYDHFRFVLDAGAIGIADLRVEYSNPTGSDEGPNDGFYLDDYELVWYRASHDVIGAFTDQGDGTYTADISSDATGTAEVTCIYYGGSTPIETDGTGDNSGYAEVIFQ